METNRLYRSSSNSVIGGVCGGLAEYLNADPVIFRVLFVLAILIGGGGLLLYVILWIVIPLKEAPIIQSAKFNSSTNYNNSNMENYDKNPEPKKQDADVNKKQKNDGNLWGGMILITLGALFLIDRFVPRIDFGDLWPLILIVIGVVLIMRNYQKPEGKDK
ncbi:MAG: PspC domain-containing protein [Bacteroidetes bacterium]|nr:MAG: PspC domain-containing protein [Bacteroidota bacterium]